MITQTCLICNTTVKPSPRYPKYVCRDCYKKPADINGRKLQFSNVSISGGYVFCYADSDDKEEYKNHDFYIDGIKCKADEARFGGIVIEALGKSIMFYHLDKPYGFFSNFAPYVIYLKDKVWPTSEHYFQAQKFVGTRDEEQIRQTQTPREAAKIG